MILSKIKLISYYTFKELFKSKILLNVFFIGIALVLITFAATEFTYGVPERVALDFGLGMLSLSTMGISLFLGVGLLSKEIDSRTVYMIISRPVPRYAFIIGKISGLLGILSLNVLLLSVMTLIVTVILGGEVTSLLFWAILFTFLESLVLLLVVVLLSLFVNNTLSVICSVVLLLLGHFLKETQEIAFVKNRFIFNLVLRCYHFVLPAFDKLNLKEYVIYNNNLPLSYIMPNLLYAVSYSAALLCFIIYVFNRKNID